MARLGSGRFQKGQSGNPGGRPKELVEIKELARSHTNAAMNALHGIAIDPTAPASARVAAAEALLNRGWGRPSQFAGDASAEPVELIVSWIDQ